MGDFSFRTITSTRASATAWVAVSGKVYDTQGETLDDVNCVSGSGGGAGGARGGGAGGSSGAGGTSGGGGFAGGPDCASGTSGPGCCPSQGLTLPEGSACQFDCNCGYGCEGGRCCAGIGAACGPDSAGHDVSCCAGNTCYDIGTLTPTTGPGYCGPSQ
jgi:hypothetical protein